MADVLPWLNLLLLPIVGMLYQIGRKVGIFETVQAEHGRRLDRVERRQDAAAEACKA